MDTIGTDERSLDTTSVYDPSEAEDEDVAVRVRYEISSYGADYPVDGLVKRVERDDIYIPEFQREFVWSYTQASRFIESLLLGLPVPGIFLFKDDDQRLMVVDGQQRLLTLKTFYEGVFKGKEFRLKGVASDLLDKTYRTLEESDRRALDDAIVHATIFQQEGPTGNRDSIYYVFERLNTGGTPLTAQEIRASVARGPFNDLLGELDTDPNWRSVVGRGGGRGKGQELILRFFALLYEAEHYKRPMKSFLNEFMSAHRTPTFQDLNNYRSVFKDVARIANLYLTPKAFRPEKVLNVALTDAILVGLGKRMLAGPLKEPEQVSAAHTRLLSDQQFVDAYKKTTTDETNLKTRTYKATEAFAKVP
jgi:hypothetical protein